MSGVLQVYLMKGAKVKTEINTSRVTRTNASIDTMQVDMWNGKDLYWAIILDMFVTYSTCCDEANMEDVFYLNKDI